MNLSDFVKKINHVIADNKTDSKVMEGPLFIQNETDQIIVPIMDEEKEEIFIDTPVRHNKLKRKCDNNPQKTRDDQSLIIENENIGIIKPEIEDKTLEVNQINDSKIERIEGQLSDETTSEEKQEMLIATIKEHFPEIYHQNEMESSVLSENHRSKKQLSQIESIDSMDKHNETLKDQNGEIRVDSEEQKGETKKKRKRKPFFEKYLKLPEEFLLENCDTTQFIEKKDIATAGTEMVAAKNNFENNKNSLHTTSKNQWEDFQTTENVHLNNIEIIPDKDIYNKEANHPARLKNFFSKITTSVFFTSKDLEIGSTVFFVCLFIFVGTVLTSAKPVKPETFASFAGESGLSVTDITQTFSEKTEGVISSMTAISETGWTADFDVFTNGDIARQNWEKNVRTASQYKKDSILENQKNRNNIMTYSLVSNGYFFYIAKINHTVLSIAALDTNREAAETFIAKLGYH